MGRPYDANLRRPVVGVRVDVSTRHRLLVLAERRGVGLADVLREAIDMYLEAHRDEATYPETARQT
jgi:hypothetical protein